MVHKIKLLVLAPLLALALVSCRPLSKPEQTQVTNFITLQGRGSLGQSFTARYDGLETIGIYLKPGLPGSGNIWLHLKSDPDAASDLATGSMPLQRIKESRVYPFRIAQQTASNQKDYYLQLDIEGDGSVQVGTAAGNTYLNGALYQDRTAQDAQLAFWLGYGFEAAMTGLIKEGGLWLAWLAASIFLFVVPGWGLCSLVWREWGSLHWAEKLGVGGGVSLALYPLSFLYTYLAGLHLGPIYAWLLPLAGLAAIAWRNRKDILGLPNAILSKRLFFASFQVGIPWPDIALLTIIGLIFAVRFWAIRSLEIPMYGDSYQHSVIAQLIVNNKGLFSSWAPYSELTTFTYHFGFHCLVAVFHWITNLPIHQSVLWTGQILNGLAVVFLYPLARKINPNPWSGVATVLTAGLLVSMPMFYVNWGRYTQLAGQAILPAAIYLSWRALEEKKANWRLIALAWVSLAGVALTHYRVLIFAVAFFGAYLILRTGSKNFLKLVLRIFQIGAGAAVLFLPWFTHLFAGKILQIFYSQVTTPASQTLNIAQETNAIGNISSYLPVLVWLALPLLIGWGLWRRSRGVALVALWWFLIFILANPNLVHLPGLNAINNFSIIIAAYIPASLLLGEAIGALTEGVELRQAQNPLARKRVSGTLVGLLAAAFLIAFGIWGARQRLWDVRPPEYSLVTRPDLQAFQWIEENTPQNARFLVNSFPAYENSLIAGSDAGWWLPLLAGRQTSLPPLLYGTEAGPGPDYIAKINKLTADILAKGVLDPEVLNILHERGLDHIYIGQQQGGINSPAPLFTADQLIHDRHFQPIYHKDRVWIFKINFDN